jgi:CubicO group peptidase (beta-lactamase class C family)
MQFELMADAEPDQLRRIELRGHVSLLELEQAGVERARRVPSVGRDRDRNVLEFESHHTGAGPAWRSLAATDDHVPLQEVLDDAVSDLVESDAPGALAMAVGPWGERLSVAGVDALGEPLRPTARLEVGSVTKVLVAALVLLLVEDGVLGLDDGVASLMPGLLRDDGSITLRSLLNHTSGLPDFFEDPTFRAAWQKEPQDGTRQVVFSAGTLLTSDAAWTVLDKTTWTVLRPSDARPSAC